MDDHTPSKFANGDRILNELIKRALQDQFGWTEASISKLMLIREAMDLLTQQTRTAGEG